MTAADLANDPSLTGLDQNFGATDPNIDSGVNGDGSVSTPDILAQILNSKILSSVTAAAVTGIVGGNKVVTNSSGSYQSIPSSQQGGSVGAQNKVVSFLKKIPVWTWIVGIVVFAFGVAALFFPKGK